MLRLFVLADDLTAAGSSTAVMISVEIQTDPQQHHHREKPAAKKTATFYVSDSSSDDEVDDIDVLVGLTTTETQTDESMIAECQLLAESRPPRPLQECVAILKSLVRLRAGSRNL